MFRVFSHVVLAASVMILATGRAHADDTAAGKGCGLPALSLAGMKLYNYSARWHASEWDNTGSKIPWRYNHVKQAGDDVVFTLDESGAPQLQAVQGTPAETDGIWEADVTMPELREGVVVAPLWLYNQSTKDEIDFEFTGRRGLDVSMHAWPNGEHKYKTVRIFEGTDFSNRRLCLAIKSDLASGKIDMLLDGKVVYTWDKTKWDFFISNPMRPFLELWAADPANSGLVSWTGAFTGLKPGEAMTMTVHGYRFSKSDAPASASR
jgi:hypothetical protein